MKKPWIVIDKISKTTSRLEKENIILKEAESGNDEFFKGLQMSFDKLITFGVKQVPIHSGPDGQGLPWNAFVELCNLLQTRQLTGHRARDAIELALTASLKDQWNNWYRKILIKDFQSGFSEKTVNKVVKNLNRSDYTVPVFTCALAHDSAQHEKKMTGRKQCEIKLDGCLSKEWVVEFENGQKISIKEVVDSKLKGKIKSYNTITGKVEFNEILNWAVDGQDDNEDSYEWFEIELENGVALPPLTGNHLVYLPKLKCYRRADLLNEGDEVLMDI